MPDFFHNGERADAAKFNQLALKPIALPDRAALAAYEGAAHEAVVATPAGTWRIDTTDTTSEPGDAVEVDANGQRWKPAGGDVTLNVDLIAVFDEALGSPPPTTLPPLGVDLVGAFDDAFNAAVAGD